MAKPCAHCGMQMTPRPKEGAKRFARRQYCSLRCRRPWNTGTRGVVAPNAGSFRPGLVPHNKGVPMTADVRAKVSAAKTGRRIGPCPPERRRKISEAQRGERSAAWRGGKTEESKRARESVEYRLWREAVFKRDNWTCQDCGIRGGRLDPHHVKGFAAFPELRFDVNNGLTLCRPCHKKTDSYARNAA